MRNRKKQYQGKFMTKILGVMGSPRKNGNTHILVTRMLDGAREQGAEADIIFLGDHDIKECNGCLVCWDGKECPKNDDMNAFYPKIIESDVLIFGTPVYWYGPTALMKGFIDRFVYFNCPENRAKIKGKSAVLAIPFEEESTETASLSVSFFEKSLGYLEMKLAGIVLVPGVSRKGDVLEKTEKLKEAYDVGRRLVSSKKI